MEKIIATIDCFNLPDFFTTAPFEYLRTLQGSSFVLEQANDYMAKRAKDVGFKNFSKKYRQYIDSISPKKTDAVQYSGNYTNFSDQAVELACGLWIATDEGIRRPGRGDHMDYACCHPIIIISELIDIDTHSSKIQLAYRVPNRTNGWETLVVDAATISTSRAIIALAAWGIDVTSNTAVALVDYLQELRRLNYERIPVKHSYSQLGYHAGIGFAPYVDNLVFGARAEFQKLHDSVRPAGDFNEWLKIALYCRTQSVAVRIMLAAAFASILVSFLNIRPFFVHLWGPSGTGKTVSLTLTASVFGNPDQYKLSHNSTLVAIERHATFLRHLPYCIDEFQLSRDKDGKNLVYMFTQGEIRSRGQKEGGVDTHRSWSNVAVSTGESPIVDVSSGSGSVNRVINIACPTNTDLLENYSEVIETLQENYGHAGKLFVEKIYTDPEARKLTRFLYDHYCADLRNDAGATGKQAMAAACILTADHLATLYIFQDDRSLTIEDIAPYLATQKDISVGAAGYEFFRNWVITNSKNFLPKATDFANVYGAREGQTVYVLTNIFREAMKEAGYNSETVLAYLKQHNLLVLRKDARGYGVSHQVGDDKPNCYGIILSGDND